MPTYVIGDIHGCFKTLQRLLAQISFDPARDELRIVGDLINRGPGSLEVLRWARDLGPCLVTVLGNHDLHLLATALGIRPPKEKDKMRAIFDAPDSDELIQWVRERPLIHRGDRTVIVHAGLHPGWTITEAEALARKIERNLQGESAAELLEALYQKPPPVWNETMPELAQLGAALKVFVAIRTCSSDGVLCHGFAGPPEEAPPGCEPWFRIPSRRSQDTPIYFGHWAALGLHREQNTFGLDTGCAWGGQLTAIRLEDGQLFHEALADEVRVA